jgi:hypothetical protein
MKVSFGNVDGNGWESYGHKVLRIKYLEEDYVRVPAQYGGDLGIESFTKTGKAFQCYCPDGEPSSDELYEKQRNKVTRDINKLVKNGVELTSLGATKIKKWYLVTPRYENKELIAHCEKKANEVKKKKCSHIDDDFVVLILTEDDFVIENGKLLSAGAFQVIVKPRDTTASEVINWRASSNQLYNNIHSKISNINNVKDVDQYVDINIKDYLAGQDMLARIHRDYPDLFETLVALKNSQELKVERFSMMPTGEPSEFLQTCFHEYEAMITRALGNAISAATITHLTAEAIADWLIRCPLRF